jgi:hypothetical protein
MDDQNEQQQQKPDLGDPVGQAGQGGVDVPAEGGRKRGPHPDAGKYVVLAADPAESGLIYREAGKFEATSAREAKAKALEQRPKLREAVQGDGVHLAAVPAMSWKPTLVKAEQPPPIVKGL